MVHVSPVQSLRIALALSIGTAGGALFYWLDMPLAWMLGAIAGNTVAALAGAPVAFPPRLRTPFIAVLGVLLGSAFTPDIIAQAPHWLGGLAMLAVYVAVSGGIVFLFFRRIAGFDTPTAYFASAPGGLNEMIIIGEAMGGDMRVISLIHACRILFVVMLVPFYFRWATDLGAIGARPPGVSLLEVPPGDGLILLACGVVGFLAARLMSIRAAHLLGPMVISAAVHLGGITASSPPVELVAIAQVVLGSAIGTRFAGFALRRAGKVIVLAMVSTALMLATTMAFAALFGSFTGLRPEALVLALAPGGLAEMSLVALALGIDTAFVSTMHIARIAMVIAAAPPLFRRLEKRRRA